MIASLVQGVGQAIPIRMWWRSAGLPQDRPGWNRWKAVGRQARV